MKFLDRFSIKGRLFATLGLVLAMLGGIVAISTWSSHASLAALRSIVNGELVKFQLVAAVDSSTKGNSRNVLELFAVSSLEQQKSIRKRMGDTRKNIDDLLLQLDGLISEPRGRELFNAVVQRRIQFVQSFSTASELLTQGKGEEARSLLFSGVLPAIDALQTPISALLEYQKALANQTAKQTEIAMEREAILIVVLGLIALALGVGSALLLIRAIVRPLELAKSVATQIGKGNLAIQFDIEGKNELSDMLMALHFMQDALAHVIMRLQENATSVALSSEEIAKANIDLSARTESQASSLEETAAAMEEMTASVQQNAKATKLANDLADEASTNAQEVGELVGQMVETMRDIHTSSQRINDIVGVIDSIAFQTNILALNAAVEAARAGEQGRGFAVVASEVRSLAQRSASAAQEIKVIISQNTEKMELGNSRAIKAGESVRQAVVVIRNVTQTVSNVALATREQAQGIAQVGQAVAQLDEVTQQNAALVEETAAATQSLNEQVQALKGTINRFQIGQRATPSFA